MKKRKIPKISEQELLDFLRISKNLRMNPAQKEAFVKNCIPLLCELVKQLDSVGIMLIALIQCNNSLFAVGTNEQSEIGKELINSVTSNPSMYNELNKNLN